MDDCCLNCCLLFNIPEREEQIYAKNYDTLRWKVIISTIYLACEFFYSDSVNHTVRNTGTYRAGLVTYVL